MITVCERLQRCKGGRRLQSARWEGTAAWTGVSGGVGETWVDSGCVSFLLLFDWRVVGLQCVRSLPHSKVTQLLCLCVTHTQTFFLIFSSTRILDVFLRKNPQNLPMDWLWEKGEAEATPRLLVWQQDEWSRHFLTRGPLPTSKWQCQPAPGPEVWGETWVRM